MTRSNVSVIDFRPIFAMPRGCLSRLFSPRDNPLLRKQGSTPFLSPSPKSKETQFPSATENVNFDRLINDCRRSKSPIERHDETKTRGNPLFSDRYLASEYWAFEWIYANAVRPVRFAMIHYIARMVVLVPSRCNVVGMVGRVGDRGHGNWARETGIGG